MINQFDLHRPPPPTPYPVMEASVEYPSTSEMAASFAKSIGSFVKSGFTTADSETLNFRLEICKSCELWDESGFAKTGRCKKCGCSTQAKLRMATEKCPIGKW